MNYVGKDDTIEFNETDANKVHKKLAELIPKYLGVSSDVGPIEVLMIKEDEINYVEKNFNRKKFTQNFFLTIAHRFNEKSQHFTKSIITVEILFVTDPNCLQDYLIEDLKIIKIFKVKEGTLYQLYMDKT